jgi:hypothetical protein
VAPGAADSAVSSGVENKAVARAATGIPANPSGLMTKG